MALLDDTWITAARSRAAHPALVDARRALDDAVASYHGLLPEIPERQAEMEEALAADRRRLDGARYGLEDSVKARLRFLQHSNSLSGSIAVHGRHAAALAAG